MPILVCVKPNLNLKNNIAVVGSSGKLFGSGSGKDIDRFEEVVRFNRAPTKGFENDVGQKETLRVTNAHCFACDKQEEMLDWPGQDLKLILKLRNSKILFGSPFKYYKKWERGVEKIHKSNELYQLTKGFEKIQKKYEAKGRLLSMGLTFVLLAVESGIFLNIWGFDLNPSIRTHYFSERRPEGAKCHNFKSEKNILVRLQKDKKIKLF